MAARHWLILLCFAATAGLAASQASAATVFTSAQLVLAASATGPIIRGVGNANLIGNDLTDLGNNGVEVAYTYPAGVFPANLGGFDATFFASAEPNFNTGEAAFNVFDNQTGGGDNKWCCNPVSDAVDGAGQSVGADFSQTLATGTLGIVLNRFTITSGNDAAGRDPDVWSIQGSNDGTTWTDIFNYGINGTTPFTQRDQVLEYSVANADFVTPDAFKQFRLFVDSTGNEGPGLQLGELEFFGDIVDTAAVPEPTTVAMWSVFGLLGLAIGWRRCSRTQ